MHPLALALLVASSGAGNTAFVGAGVAAGALVGAPATTVVPGAGPTGTAGLRLGDVFETALDVRELVLVEQGLFGSLSPTITLGARLRIVDGVDVALHAGPSLLVGHGITSFYFGGLAPGLAAQASLRMRLLDATSVTAGFMLGGYQLIGTQVPFACGTAFAGIVQELAL